MSTAVRWPARNPLVACIVSVLSMIPCAAPLAAADAPSRGPDWAFWRGPEKNGYSHEKDLPDSFSVDPKAPSNLIWRAPYGGRTTPIVLNNRVYLINAVGEGIDTQERVLCLDADTGNVLWHKEFNVWHTGIVRVRLGWTTLVGDPETGNVYAHGTQGLLLCFDKDGKVLWQHSLTEEYGRVSGYGGRLTSPIVDEDRVIIGMVDASWGKYASGGTRFIAFDKRTGEVVWTSNSTGRPKDTFLSNPIVAVINGERLMLSGTANGSIVALKARTGETVWQYTYGTAAVNCSPVVNGDRIYIGHGEPNFDSNKQGNFICLDGAKIVGGQPTLVWKADGVKARFASPILHDNRIYVCDEIARMCCLDADTGKQVWTIVDPETKKKSPYFTYGQAAMGSPILADGKIYVAEVNARFHILEPGATSCKELSVTQFDSKTDDEIEINGSPSIYNGRVYFCTSQEMYCIGKKGHSATSGPGSSRENIGGPLGKPAHVQVVPADVVLHPGESVAFKARLFDEHGNFLKEVKADWSPAAAELPEGIPPPPPPKDGPPPAGPPPLKGTIDADGKLTVDKAPPLQMGGVVAKVEGLTGQGRVRVVPRYPFAADFSKVPLGRTPSGWVNTQGKFAVQALDGKNVLVKLANNASPLVARANAYIGLPTDSDYTIECDVRGTKVGESLPEMGVSANRYTLMLDGEHQSLRIHSWDALPRVDRTITYSWQPDTWYHLKLAVDVKGDTAVIHGKVWKRGDSEPKAWTIETRDPHANKEGCPAVYGNATGIIGDTPGCLVYFDNLVIAPNKKEEK